MARRLRDDVHCFHEPKLYEQKRAPVFVSCFGPVWQYFTRSNICCALHAIANSLRQSLEPGANSPSPSQIRRLLSERSPSLPTLRLQFSVRFSDSTTLHRHMR
jgi:hypothetical protein